MSMMDMNPDSLSRQIGEPVPEMYVIIAKNSVVGIDEAGLCDLLGATKEEIAEVTADPVYKTIRLLIAAEHAKESVDADLNWDGIEGTALRALALRVKNTVDTDTLLRIAAVANKAVRRHRDNGPKILDPSIAGQRVGLSLTRRIYEKLENGTTRVAEETRSISVTDGSAVNPSFKEVDQLLQVSARPRLPANFATRTHEPDFTVEDLEYKG